MKIGIDYDPALRANDGIAVYVRELVFELVALEDNEIYLFGETNAGMPVRPRIFHFAHGMKPLEWRIYNLKRHLGIGKAVALPKIDVYHATDYVFPPRCASINAVVVSIHDIMPITRPFSVSWRHLVFFMTIIALIKIKKPLILVPTHIVKEQIWKALKIDETNIVVIPYGAGRTRRENELVD
jgi:hypothetical protein